MKERPILFSGPMVTTILEGRKTQTRRVISPQIPDFVQNTPDPHPPKHEKPYFDSYCSERRTPENPRGMSNLWCWWTRDDRPNMQMFRCPYGQPGDRLWVRETFRYRDLSEPPGPEFIYRATAVPLFGEVWKPAIHMPRTASRLTLEILKVRVERAQDISEADAKAEGVEETPCWKHSHEPKTAFCRCYRDGYRQLWDSINAKRGFGWDANPWVWVIEFKAVGA
jgi:hypothetical protein